MMFSSDAIDSNFSEDNHSTENSIDNQSNHQDNAPKQRILIGSQRNPDAYRPKPAVPVVSEDGSPIGGTADFDNRTKDNGENLSIKSPLKTGQVVFSSEVGEKTPPLPVQEPVDSIPTAKGVGNARHPKGQRSFSSDEKQSEKHDHPKGKGERRQRQDEEIESNEQNKQLSENEKIVSLRSNVNIPVPTIRGDLPDDLQEEFEELFGDGDLDSLMSNIDQVASQTQIETETKQKGKVLSIGKESVFIELGGREQGIIPLKQFKAEPQVGQEFEVIVIRFLEEEGLYELSLPLAAADVSDWSQIEN
ncbi:MAG: hypothetical protein FWC50_14445, partial [Planctomycetaceae bacterium]|nr:hypothetical protein [Planctomycetaceae bacterium]